MKGHQEERSNSYSEVFPTTLVGSEMSFSKTKDRFFSFYETIASWLARRPRPIRRAVYSVFGTVLWGIYLLPGNKVRPTLVALVKHIGSSSPAKIYMEFVRNLFLGIDRLERVRHGFGAEIDEMLVIPESNRIEQLLDQKGFILVLPHVHGSFAMARGLSQVYPVMSLVRLTKNKKRADAQWNLYQQIGCDVLDVRNENPTSVARKMLRKLKTGTIVVGVVDGIDNPPTGPTDETGDLVSALAFGERIGVTSWPARFAIKAGVPIVPATVELTDTEIRLILGKTIVPTANMGTTTQDWMNELELLFRTYPKEWAFWLDKHWSRVLRKNPPE
jgi:lauroyl/myristoyl acyltransferase